MPTTSLDQILQITTAPRPAPDSAKPSAADGKRFQEHLQQASTSEKPTNTSETAKSQSQEEENDLTLAAGQEHESSLEQGDVAAPVIEGEESVEQTTEEIAGFVTTDEILISANAIAELDPTVAGEIDAEAEIDQAVTVQPTVVENSLEENIVTVSTATETIAETLDSSPSEDGALEGEQSVNPTSEVEQEQNVEVTETLEQLAVSIATKESLPINESQQNVEVSQSDTLSEVAEQSTFENPNQNLGGNSGSQQQPTQNEAELGKVEQLAEGSDTESKPASESAEKTNKLVDTLERVSHSTAEADTEPAPAVSTPVVEVNSETSNEPVTSLEKPAGTAAADSSTAAAESRAETEPVPTTDRVRFVQRVSGAIRAAKDQDGLVQLKLSPPELGSLKIELSVQQGVLTAKLEAETAAARNVLLDNLPALRERLAEQEIRIEKFDVDVRDEGHQQEFTGAEDRDSNKASTSKVDARTENQSEENGNMSSMLNPIRTSEDLTGGLDVRI